MNDRRLSCLGLAKRRTGLILARGVAFILEVRITQDKEALIQRLAAS
jgi:hypothetical protein